MNYINIVFFFIVIIAIIFIVKFNKKNNGQVKTMNYTEENTMENDDSEMSETIKDELDESEIQQVQNIKREKHLKKREKHLKKKEKKDMAFLDIGINNQNIGRIVIELFSKITPKTCNNFKALCVNPKYSYKKCPIHRIIQNFMIQMGDFTNGDGTGGMSIYGDRFEDENFTVKHDQPYLVSMANAGPNTNGSQFFITTVETPHLDGKHVVFGKVIEGFEIIDILNNVKTDNRDKPIENIRIINCGTIDDETN